MNNLKENSTQREEIRQIGETILRQMGGYGRLKAMIGIYDLAVGQDAETKEVYLQFKFKGNPAVNCARITLTVWDTYTLEYFSIRKRRGAIECRQLEERTVEDVYNDQLKRAFESETGLYLSL